MGYPLFFYGILVAVGGLASLGYLQLISGPMYETLGPTNANILVGILSAIIDNIPIVYAVLTAHPEMDMGQWLLITLNCRYWWIFIIYWFCSRCCFNGSSQRCVHLLCTFKMGMGYLTWICCLYRCSPFDESTSI